MAGRWLPLRRWYSTSRSLLSTPSYWHNTGLEPLSPLTIGQLVDSAAERYGDREALVSLHQNQRLSFIDVRDQANTLAAGFRQIGLQHGDRLGIWAPNCTQWYLTSLAAAKEGLVLVNINPACQPPEVQHCLNKVGVKAVVVAESFKTQNYHQMITSLAPELTSASPGQLHSRNLPHLRSLVVISKENMPGSFRFDDVMESGRAVSRHNPPDVQPDDGCNILFTSGTTGKPKGAFLSHHNLVNNAYFIGVRLRLQEKHHRICLQVPLFHCFGNVIGILTALHHGATLVFPGEGYNSIETVKATIKERCTVVYGTPTMLLDMLASSVKLGTTPTTPEVILTAGAPASSQLIQQLYDFFKLDRVCSCYGMTETSPISFQSRPTDSQEKMTTTVGCVADHTEVKVVDPEGKMVPMGTPGELCVRGYVTMLGYWGEDEKTKEMIGADGWLRTGDQFVLEEDGYGKIVGRLKDMIIRGGENIFPKEIEEFLETHPDIVEAQVLGLPDARMGEEICACIRLRDEATLTDQQLRAYCKGNISKFKIPRYIRVVSDFPKTVSGKIQKFRLREMMSDAPEGNDERRLEQMQSEVR